MNDILNKLQAWIRGGSSACNNDRSIIIGKHVSGVRVEFYQENTDIGQGWGDINEALEDALINATTDPTIALHERLVHYREDLKRAEKKAKSCKDSIEIIEEQIEELKDDPRIK